MHVSCAAFYLTPCVPLSFERRGGRLWKEGLRPSLTPCSAILRYGLVVLSGEAQGRGVWSCASLAGCCNDDLGLVVTNHEGGQVQVCASEHRGDGGVVYTESHNLAAEEQRMSLGSFARDSCVVRVTVDDILVRNLTFAVDQLPLP